MDDILSIVKDGIAVAGSWKTVGTLLSLVALLRLVVSFTKTQLGQKLIGSWSTKHKWIRPLIAAVLGLLVAGLGAYAAGQGWLAVLSAGVAGALAGMAATGTHEVQASLQPSERARRDAAATVADALAGADRDARVAVDALKGALDEAVSKPTPQARVAALAAWMKANPPKKD